METGFGDRHDETLFYIVTYREKLAERNLIQLERLIRVYAAFYFVFLIFSYILEDSFSLDISYFIVPIVLLSFWKIIDVIRHRSCNISFFAVRVLFFAFFLVLGALVVYIEVVTYPDYPAILTPIMLLAVPWVYVDYFGAVAALEVGILLEYAAFHALFQGTGLLTAGGLICVVAATVALYGYWVVLYAYTTSAQQENFLKEEGSTDLLTGLYNKLSFEKKCKDYLKSRDENGHGVLMIFDFDNFKSVNDNYGHQAGDAILKKFGDILKKNFRDNDIVGRIGGDEFMVLMTGVVPDEIIDLRCNTIEHELYVSKVGKAGGFSCSIGVAAERARFSFGDLYKFADAALYEAKERGKATFVKRYANEGEIPPEHQE